MADDDGGTEALRGLAVRFNGEAWALLKTAERSAEDELRMIHAAHASLYCWLAVGTAVQEQRGLWLLSHVDAELGMHPRRSATPPRAPPLPRLRWASSRTST